MGRGRIKGWNCKRIHAIAVRTSQISVSEKRKLLKTTLSHSIPKLVLITIVNHALFLFCMKCILTLIKFKALIMHLAGDHTVRWGKGETKWMVTIAAHQSPGKTSSTEIS